MNRRRNSDEAIVDNVKSCPFCGGPAEIQRTASEIKYADAMNDIPANVVECVTIEVGGVKTYRYRERRYCPRCKDVYCIGRLRKQYKTVDEAREEWNRRTSKVQVVRR